MNKPVKPFLGAIVLGGVVAAMICAMAVAAEPFCKIVTLGLIPAVMGAFAFMVPKHDEDEHKERIQDADWTPCNLKELPKKETRS